MIGEFHFYFGVMTLSALLLSALIGYTISGMAYPGTGAPFLPDGPVRKLVVVNVAFLAVCGALALLGV